MGFEHAGAVLQQTHGDLIISKQKLRKIEGIELIRLRQDQGQQNLGFTSRPFVLCGLPLRRPPRDNLIYERRNGHFKLQITGHPEFGLPFGQDRLIPIFLATLAVRQQSRTVRFKSGAAVLEMFGLSKGGKEYRRIIQGFERIFGATIFFGTETTDGHSRVVHRAKFNFMQQARIWYEGGGSDDNMVVLSEEFYAEVLAHPIPSDLDVIRVLAASPGPWTFSSGCHTAGSQRKLEPAFRYLVRSGLPPNSAASSIRGPAGSAPSSQSGFTRFG